VVSHQEVVRDAAESALWRIVGVVAVITPSAALIQVLTSARDYRQPAVAVAVWLAMFAVAACMMPRIRAGGLTGAEAVVAVLIAVAAVAAIGLDHRPHYPVGSTDLVILGTFWLPVLVALSHPARAWLTAALTVFAVHALLVIRAVGASPLSLAQLEAAGYILMGILIVFAAARPTIALHTSMTVRRASLASRSEAERAAAAAVQKERRSRLALLELDALPLLRGIADGTLDPAAATVRDECARHAAMLRHSLTGRPPADGDIEAWLQPTLTAAATRGLLVSVQVIGDPELPPPGVADLVRATVEAVISALPPHPVMLTVLDSGDDAEMYVTFSAPLRGIPDVARHVPDVPGARNWQAAVITEQTGAGCLEMSWRKASAA